MDRLDFSHQQQPLTDAPASDTSAAAGNSAPPSHYHASASPAAPQDPSKHAFLPPTATSANSAPTNPAAACDIKPRLTKDQHDILEAEYQRQNKPNTNTKRAFAESLNVTLDKVNNWFQNRRAKAKSDAKKAAEQENLYQDPQDQPATSQPAQESKTESLAAMTNDEIINSMDQWAHDGLPEEMNVSSNGATNEHASQQQNSDYQHQGFDAQQFLDLSGSRNLFGNQSQPFFDSQQDFNRRTLTQEQFDAFALDGGFFDAAGNFQNLDAGFSSDHNALEQVFPQTEGNSYKHHDSVVFPYGPLAGYDLSSDTSNQTMHTWSSPNFQSQTNLSANTSDHTASRASSLSFAPDEPQFPSANVQHSQPQPQPSHSSGQWQPGQSVPVDINALNEQFRQAAQNRPTQPPRVQSFDQVIGWPSEDASLRRGSSTSLLAQSLSNVGIHTPQPASSGGFKSPAPPSNIAARRQRARPAALGLTALRSQSYSDGLGPATAGPTMQHGNQNGNPSLRRIRSSNLINGIAQGRVMKSIPGSAQRSPLNFSFSEAMHSPKFARQFSTSEENLTPPSPSSPNEHRWSEQNGQYPLWPSMAAQGGHQSSTSDAEAPAGLTFQSLAGMSHNYAGSPPHTPHHLQQTFAQQLGGNFVLPENTPPQSAPATQQNFPSGVFSQPPPPPPPQPAAAPAQPSRPATTQPQQQSASGNGTAAYPQQHYMNVIVPDQHQPSSAQQQSGVGFSSQKQFTRPPQIPIQFANGVPTVDADGNMQMTFQNQPTHYMPNQYPSAAQGRPSPPYSEHSQGLNINNPSSGAAPPSGGAHMNYQFVSAPGSTQFPSAPSSSLYTFSTAPPPPPPPPQELHVQEYVPPADLKSSSSPRRPVDLGGPKNYTFSNHTSEYFEANGKGVKKTGSGSSGGGSAPSVSSADGSAKSTGNASASPESSQGSSAGSSAFGGSGIVLNGHIV